MEPPTGTVCGFCGRADLSNVPGVSAEEAKLIGPYRLDKGQRVFAKGKSKAQTALDVDAGIKGANGDATEEQATTTTPSGGSPAKSSPARSSKKSPELYCHK